MNQSTEAASTRAKAPIEGDEWLSIAEAAALLHRSERTVRRRCESGELAAQLEAGESGGRVWRIDRAAIFATKDGRADKVKETDRMTARPDFESENGDRPKRADARGHIDHDRAANRADVRPQGREDAPEQESGARVLAETEAKMLREALENERQQTAFLRAQVEAANRQAAEATASVRELTRALNTMKALPSREYSQGETGAQKPQEAPTNAEPNNQPATTKDAAQRTPRREPRPLWKLLLGLR